VFRIHAEFQLGDGWFTPSQFTGHLVINRPEETGSFFQMRVPEGPVNFEVGWQDDPYSVKGSRNAFRVKISVF
jgi:hypothetical protein